MKGTVKEGMLLGNYCYVTGRISQTEISGKELGWVPLATRLETSYRAI